MIGSRCWVLGCFCVALLGCEGGADFADLDAYMSEVHLQSPGAIDPPPVMRSYPSVTYGASALRSPFQPPQRVEQITARQGASAVRPNSRRVRQHLEGFDIEQLQMVGTLSRASGRFALLRSAGGVFPLQVGDYLGRNEGRIVAISESRVDVVEIVADGAGAWQERPRTLSLKKHS
ncbi:pilus assembly protein PilP [Pseudomonas sp. BNK-6]|uniref:pilus assembly protein PilP n=1 Tax=Pseudomonas TaxID=286 RepID=UPI000C9C4547|nr:MULTISPECIES: pilus assembly protein PilP [Pseudomonas]PNG32820.1 pilus assembly protein PilP [Pseudomonas protegens]BCT30949.1 type 4 fimbrial biogenesis protein PilP [Pseudomonas protegens]